MNRNAAIVCLIALPAAISMAAARNSEIVATESSQAITIATPDLEAAVRKQGYVSGVAGGSFLDKKTGFRDAGFGLDIVDWIMEPGSDEAYRDQLPGDLPYLFNNLYHGKRAKRSIEGPQICTKAKAVSPRIIRGDDFVAVKMDFQYYLAAPGKKTGSRWEQTLVFPAGKRYFISSDKITTVNASDAMFLRVDMPGHIKHTRGDTFSEVYLSYLDKFVVPPSGGKESPTKVGTTSNPIPASEFFTDFAPDEKFIYRRDTNKPPQRFIRAYHLRDPKTGRDGPWLAGMTLDPSVVYEAWCHQRGYVCMIEEFGGRPIRPGESFSAAFVVGFFDSIEEMSEVYDALAGHSALEVTKQDWKLTGRR